VIINKSILVYVAFRRKHYFREEPWHVRLVARWGLGIHWRAGREARVCEGSRESRLQYSGENIMIMPVCAVDISSSSTQIDCRRQPRYTLRGGVGGGREDWRKEFLAAI